MNKEERSKQILSLLNEENYVSARRLAAQLYVSLPTIRRDLADLARQGMIQRSHGGARRLGEGHAVIPLAFRESFKTQEKKKMCRAAAALVHDGDVIFLDASTTVAPIAECLRDRRAVRLITNSLHTAALASSCGMRTYCTGGELMEESFSLVGAGAAEFAARFHIDLFFFSSYGVSPDGMIVDTGEEETALRRAVFPYARKRVFLCGSEKFMLTAPFNVAPLDAMDCVITDAPLPDGIRAEKERILVV